MSTITRRRRVAAVAAGALGAGALAFVSVAPAHAAQTGQPVAGSASLAWSFSDVLHGGIPGLAGSYGALYTAPATYSADTKVSTWSTGDATVAGDGHIEADFTGTAVIKDAYAGAWVTIADPQVEVSATGDGEISALVAYGSGAGPDTGPTWDTRTTIRSAERVDLVDLEADPQADDATYPDALADVPFASSVAGGVITWSGLKGHWSPALLDFLDGDSTATPAIPNFTYNSQFVNQVDSKSRVRFPAPITITADATAAAVTPTIGAPTADGVPIDVAATGFAQTAPGLYVSIREKGTADPAYDGGFGATLLATAWVSNDSADVGTGPQSASAAIAADGSFGTSLLLPRAAAKALDPTKSYTIITRKAHGDGPSPAHADQVTETPLDTAALIAAAAAMPKHHVVPTLTAPAKLAFGTAGKASVALPGVTGSVTLNGLGAARTLALTEGAATFPIPAGTAAGTYTLTASFAGDDDFDATTSAPVVVTVAKPIVIKSAPALSPKLPKKIKAGKAVTLTLSLGKSATGRVKVTIKRGKKTLTKTLVLKSGHATLKLTKKQTKKLGKGTWKITTSYAGNATTKAATKTTSVRVK